MSNISKVKFSIVVQEVAKLSVTASCCDSVACRLCAVQYLAR